jgi:[ribosomal protein S5]-alanine N-acetyltransferase
MTILIESERLIIKAPSESDFENFYAQQSDADVMKYIGRGVRSSEEVRKGLAKSISHYEKHGFTFGPVFEKASGRCVGQAGLIYLAYDDTQDDIEVGYRFIKECWGKGYATEISRALVTWAFAHLAIKKCVGIIQPQNEGSRHVLEKIGMHYVGKATYYGIDVERYEIDKV